MNTMGVEYFKQLDLLDGMERELYRILDYFTASSKGSKCRPSIASIAAKLKRSRNTTKKYLRLLLAKGFISIQARKAIGKVTDNKYNQTHEYTLLLKKFNKVVVPKANGKKSKFIVCKENDIDIIVRELSVDYSSSAITSALKTMRTNMRNGTIVRCQKSYLKALINISNDQLAGVEQAIETMKDQSKVVPSNKKSSYNNPNKNKVNTKFHNFEQRTSNYSPEQLEKMVLDKVKRK